MLVALIGFISGIVSGMGIGGGTVLIPSLVFFAGAGQQIAQSVNLLVFIPSAAAALVVHFRKGNIEKRLLLKLVALGSIGAVSGSLLAVNLNPALLKKIFGLFLFAMGIYEIRSKSKKKSEDG